MNNNTILNSGLLKTKLYLYIKLISIFLISSFTSYSQIQAPDLYCIKNDTLFWNLPNNSCGSFISYQVYVSKNINGPYTLLADITDPNQTKYFDSTVNGMSLFYYMQSNLNCPGQTQLSSDTLDNQLPPFIVIDSVTVINGKVSIAWQAITSEQLSYIIYKNTPSGTLPVDTVFNTNTYVDQNSNPQNKSEIYYVLSMDLCGNTSIFDEAHYSIYLTNPKDSCSSAIKLNWTPYQNWPNGVKEYQVWVSINKAQPILHGTVSGNTTNYQITDLVAGDSLCITITAVQSNSNITSTSNEICLVAKTIWATIYNSSVDTNNLVNLAWKWSTNLPFKNAELFAGTNTGNINTLLPFTAPPVLPDSILFLDLNSNPVSSPLYYQLRITDFCNNFTYSNILSTVHLTATATAGFNNKLDWQFPAHDNISVSGYSIYRIVNNQKVLISQVSGTDFSLLDAVDIENPDEEFICYYIIAEGIAEILPGITQTVQIQSNIACVGQSGSLFFPNAIVPDGVNNEFRPIGVFTDNGAYNLQIYDRWGKKVFETTNINESWKGYSNDVALPMGLYAYIAELKQINGNVINQKGTVMLIR